MNSSHSYQKWMLRTTVLKNSSRLIALYALVSFLSVNFASPLRY